MAEKQPFPVRAKRAILIAALLALCLANSLRPEPLLGTTERPKNDCVRVIVGIFTKANETARRKDWSILLRLHHDLDAPLKLACGLNFAFVAHHDDVGPLRYAEFSAHIINLKSGDPTTKSAEWFRYSLENFPEADFVAKMESDTSIHRRRLENEFAQALRAGSDFVGSSVSSDELPSYVSAGFYALSQRFSREMVQAYLSHGVLYPGDEAKSIGRLFESAGLQRSCCHSRAWKHPVQRKCSFRCRILFTSYETNPLNKNTPLFEQLSIRYSRQVSVKMHQGDAASKRFLGEVPRIVWGFWFGPPMQGNRLDAFNTLKENIGVPFNLVGPATLHLYNLTYSPMHPLVGTGSLSAVHLADYLRAYFMHHFGGGYHDIKPRDTSWNSSFDHFDDESIWLYGSREKSYDDTGCEESNVLSCGNRSMEGRYNLLAEDASESRRCCDVVRSQWALLAANGAYIVRPGTALSALWLDLVEAHMTAKMEVALASPAPWARCCQPVQPPYPFRWTELHGEAFQPAQAAYLEHVKTGLSGFGDSSYRGGGTEDRPQVSNLDT